MDIQSALICLLIFVVSAAVLLLISMFGMKEKSYEEAVAEHRKLTNGLLGTGQRPKPKEKKQKKAGKKVKEKIISVATETETVEELFDNDTLVSEVEAVESFPGLSKLHVEFEEPTVILPSQIINKKHSKKEKVRSILHSKEKTPVADINVSKNLPSNHFEQIHPKDEFELLHVHQKEEKLHRQESETKSKSSKSKKQDVNSEIPKSTKGNKNQKQQAQPQAIVEDIPVPEPEIKMELVKEQIIVKTAPIQVINSAKDKKKKKSEFNTLQQMTGGDRPGVNVSLLVPLVRKADLSRSEIQILIDMLLNKQHEAPNAHNEWSEGRADPIQKLKKQLAEKEKALSEEQEAMIGVQAKLREVRAELNSERSRLLQNCRSLEENIHAKQTEMQAMATRNHTQNQKLQQMQAQLNEEIMTTRKLREEHNAIQIQRKQMEMHLASINDQQQESEVKLQTQLSQIRVELQEQQNLNNQLSIELHTLREKSHSEKEMLQERNRHLENQTHHFKAELEQKQEVVRQLEESRRKLSEMEHNISVTHHHENELKIRCQKHLDETRRLEITQAQSHDDLNRLHGEVNRLTVTNKQQQEENERLIIQLRAEITHLQNEKIKLETENIESSADKIKEIEISNLQNELSSLRAQLEGKDSEFNVELEKNKKTIKDIETELEEQRNKNDELRKKNWKVMEALNTAESSIRNKSKQTETDAIKQQIKLEEQENNRKFLQRLFPDVSIPNNNQWMLTAETLIKNHINSLKTLNVPSENSTEVVKLQAQISNYKKIIDDTEGILTKLQTHVEHEEKKWRQTLVEKEVEIHVLKEQNKPQLQITIDELKNRLSYEQKLRQDLENDCMTLKTRVAAIPVTDHKHTQFNLAEQEQHIEENSRLADELSKERQKSRDLSEELLRVQSQNLDSLHSKTPQNHTSNGTSLELIENEFSNSASSSTISTSSTKSRTSKNKKKKNTSNN